MDDAEFEKALERDCPEPNGLGDSWLMGARWARSVLTPKPGGDWIKMSSEEYFSIKVESNHLAAKLDIAMKALCDERNHWHRPEDDEPSCTACTALAEIRGGRE